jgi:hypothetical protein
MNWPWRAASSVISAPERVTASSLNNLLVCQHNIAAITDKGNQGQGRDNNDAVVITTAANWQEGSELLDQPITQRQLWLIMIIFALTYLTSATWFCSTTRQVGTAEAMAYE